MPEQMRFERHAGASLKRVTDTFTQRGGEYGDTWKDAQWLALKAVARKMGIDLSTDQARRLGAACLYDVKYARLMGGYKDDTIVDGIAYAALLAEEERAADQA